MEEMNNSTNTMIKLTATNYSIWKSQIEDLLCCLDYEDTLLGDAGKSSEMSDKDWAKLNRKSVGKIRQWVDNSVYQHVANETNASAVWNTLLVMAEAGIYFSGGKFSYDGRGIFKNFNFSGGKIKNY